MPSWAHDFTVHPHWFSTPPPPHVSGAVHEPQSTVEPQPSSMVPQAAPTCRHDLGEQPSAWALLSDWASEEPPSAEVPASGLDCPELVSEDEQAPKTTTPSKATAKQFMSWVRIEPPRASGMRSSV